MLDYENTAVVQSVVDALRPWLRPSEGEFLIWRCPFRWHSDEGVICNAYESHNLQQVCEERGWLWIMNYNHVAVVKKSQQHDSRPASEPGGREGGQA